MTGNAGKADKPEALNTAPRAEDEALSTVPRPKEGGASSDPSPSVDKKEDDKKNVGLSSKAVGNTLDALLGKPYYGAVAQEWSGPIQELVKTKRATSAVGTMLHEEEVNRRLLWTKLTTLEVDGLDAVRTARRMEKYVVETCDALRKEMVKVQAQVKDGLARALQAETSIGAQDAELARIFDALEVLERKYERMSTNENVPGATAPFQVGGEGTTSVRPDPPQAQTRTQAGHQEATMAEAPGWSTDPRNIPPPPPDEFYSWPGSVPPMRPLGTTVQQTRSQMAGPSTSAHPFTTPIMGGTPSRVDTVPPQGVGNQS